MEFICVIFISQLFDKNRSVRIFQSRDYDEAKRILFKLYI